MKTVLAIVDSPEMVQLLQTLKENYFLTICSSLADGAAMLQHQPDALILDLHLQEGDAMTFLENNSTSLPPAVIGLTHLLYPAMLQAASERGVACLIRIPCTDKEIVFRLEALLGKKDPSLSGG